MIVFGNFMPSIALVGIRQLDFLQAVFLLHSPGLGSASALSVETPHERT